MKYIRYWCDIGYQTDDDCCIEAHPDDIPEHLIRLNAEMFFYRHCEINNQYPYGYEEISKEEYMQAKAEGY